MVQDLSGQYAFMLQTAVMKTPNLVPCELDRDPKAWPEFFLILLAFGDLRNVGEFSVPAQFSVEVTGSAFEMSGCVI